MSTPEPLHGDPRPLPPLRTVGDLRTALHQGYGFPGDAAEFEAEFARAVELSEPDLAAAARVVAAYRGHIYARHDPHFETGIAEGITAALAAKETRA
ncbi:hypothetical protein [Streptomyces gobiensis]|uniref:hypothetical protein n=1 Tax=Streptomyces gobiensis TaxID=2875706 RepID=UPI001E50874B|nr:hypothetical protein [Streptomyces gobiensis]UGY94097.1 hypothetical protein test1122_21840 [Streptomyces gobiensis]